MTKPRRFKPGTPGGIIKVKATVPKAAQRDNGMPSIAVFGAAGVSGPHFLEIERRWPTLTAAEKQRVIERVYPHMALPLEDLLK